MMLYGLQTIVCLRDVSKVECPFCKYLFGFLFFCSSLILKEYYMCIVLILVNIYFLKIKIS